jgi:metal-responsive CopG/Arc/MetJ family transcriptional regulator
MSCAKIAISIDKALLQKVDHLVDTHMFKNRSQAIQGVIYKSLEQIEKKRLANECSKLDPTFERMMADESLLQDAAEWPEY